MFAGRVLAWCGCLDGEALLRQGREALLRERTRRVSTCHLRLGWVTSWNRLVVMGVSLSCVCEERRTGEKGGLLLVPSRDPQRPRPTCAACPHVQSVAATDIHAVIMWGRPRSGPPSDLRSRSRFSLWAVSIDRSLAHSQRWVESRGSGGYKKQLHPPLVSASPHKRSPSTPTKHKQAQLR